jgi:LPS export ABC transporter protein LptC
VSRTALLGLLAVAALGACRSETTPPAVVQGKSQVDSADQFMIGMTTVLNDRGVKRADIAADSAYLFDNSSRIEMLGVNGSFYTTTGVKEGIMTAQRAQYDTRVDSMQAWGDVTIISTEGRTLKTPFLRYNKALNEMSSDSIFTISDADRTVTGIGFVSDPGLNNLQIKRGISGTAGRVNIPDR